MNAFTKFILTIFRHGRRFMVIFFYFNLYVSITFKIEVYINTHEATMSNY